MKRLWIALAALLVSACNSPVKSVTTYEYDPTATLAAVQASATTLSVLFIVAGVVAIAIIIAITVDDLKSR